MNFLVALDGSDVSEQALEHALRLAERLDASVVGVHAVEPSLFVTGGAHEPSGFADAAERFVTEALEDAEAAATRYLEDAEELAADFDVEFRTELLYGAPLVVIPEYASAEAVDGIFVGHRGLSQREEAFVGSVAKGLVERSPVPVTVVR